MALPTTFPEQNWQLGKPENMTDDECAPLPCFVDDNQVVSCWQLSPEDLAALQVNGGKVYMGVLGRSTPPIWLQAGNPFTVPGQPNEIIGTTQP